ncbi:MAG: hypothetical protein KC433_02690 [Anaerolineales bacterium]|nr:hypothetical protein [Anaerolineales bacterium]
MRAYALGWIVVGLLNLLIYCTLGGLILWRQSHSWLGVTVSLALITLPFFVWAGPRNWAAIHPLLFWPGLIAVIMGTVLDVLFLFLMPNGRFSPRWAYIPLSIGLLLGTILTLGRSGVIAISAELLSPLYIVTLAIIFLAIVFQIYRYKWDSNAVERQQAKWIIVAVALFFSTSLVWAIVFGGSVTIPSGAPRLWANLAAILYVNLFAHPFLPIAITIAILRYNLWGIDSLIRRTLVYVALSGLLAIVYFGTIILLQSIFDAFIDAQSPLVIVVSTLLIAALFTPLRGRVQTFIDRRFYRKKYDAQQVLARFAQTARDEVALQMLTAELAQVVQETFQPEQISVWLKPIQEIQR